MRGILILALALASLGGVTVASMGHAGNSHHHGRIAVIPHPWMW
jgi:hypothetical protein